MKKLEILKLIDINKTIDKNKALLSITKDKNFGRKTLPKKYWLPNIKELQEEFNVLSKEIQNALDVTESCKKHLENSRCDHLIRLKHYGLFWNHSRCVLCRDTIFSDNCINFEYSINRNKYCVDLIAKEQDNDDYDYSSLGYTNEQVYEIIMNILNNRNEDDEIDLVQEFKRLNLVNCKINEEKKVNENYILIIGGSNKQFIDDESYLYKKSIKIGLNFIDYFSELLNTKIELIDNREVLQEIKKIKSENHNLKFLTYDTIDELKENLLEQIKIPFKLIIDFSDLYEYKICNNYVSKKTYNLRLNEYFPNSHIIKIGNLIKGSLEEISEFLKNTQNYDNLYAYHDDNYYFLENDGIKSDVFENTCKNLKKILKNM